MTLPPVHQDLTPVPFHVDQQSPELDKALYDKELHDAIDHAHGTEDMVYAPAMSPHQMRSMLLRPELLEAANRVWLPSGFHYGLHIEHHSLENAGPMQGGGNKWCWHITVSPWMAVDAMFGVLRDKRAAPHFVIGGRPGVKNPVVIQMIPLNLAGRALAHPSGPPTNQADTIQVEICANTSDIAAWKASDKHYKAFANLVRLTNNVLTSSHDVPRELGRKFSDTERFSGQGWVDTKGHVGHMHCPGNDHTDPTTKFRGQNIMDLLEKMPKGGYKL